jgi:hypothetical protein
MGARPSRGLVPGTERRRRDRASRHAERSAGRSERPAGASHGDHFMRYRNPAQLPPRARRRASSSGVQIATNKRDRAARSCWLWAGICGRPRRYRGIDIFWCVESTGRLARTIDQMPDAVEARREPSPQLPGRNHRAMFDQNLELAAPAGDRCAARGRLERASGDSLARLIPLPGGKRY